MKRIIVICPHCNSRAVKLWGMGHTRMKCISCDKEFHQSEASLKEIKGKLTFVEEE